MQLRARQLLLLVATLSVGLAPAAAQAESMTTLPAMPQARLGVNLGLLPSGEVLVAGGYDSSHRLATAFRYDPSDGSTTAAATMGSPRQSAGAARLADGKILIAGGLNDSFARLSSAELYDPVANTFTATTGAMGVARQAPAAVTLADGRVLIAGGYNGSVRLTSAELYDPASGTFTATGSMSVTRYAPVGALLPDGRVLIAGGSTMTGPVSSSEIFDPVSGTFSDGPSMAIGRDNAAGVGLPDGRLLVAGGNTGSSTYSDGLEFYDPVVGTFSTGALALPAGRAFVSAVVDSQGRALFFGGTGQFNGSAQSTVYAYSSSPAPRIGSVSFPDTTVGAAAAAQSITVTNRGTETLNVGGAGPAIGGADASDFALTDVDCAGATLTYGQSCTVSVVFTPSAAGVRTASIDVPGNTTPATTSLAISATGVAIPTPTPTPTVTPTATPTPTPTATPTPTVTPTPTPPATPAPVTPAGSSVPSPQLVGHTYAKRSQVFLAKRYVTITVGCGDVACSVRIKGRAYVRGKRIFSLKARTVGLAAGEQRRIKIPTTVRQRALIRRGVGRRGASAYVRFSVSTLSTPRVERRFRVRLRRISG